MVNPPFVGNNIDPILLIAGGKESIETFVGIGGIELVATLFREVAEILIDGCGNQRWCTATLNHQTCNQRTTHHTNAEGHRD